MADRLVPKVLWGGSALFPAVWTGLSVANWQNTNDWHWWPDDVLFYFLAFSVACVLGLIVDHRIKTEKPEVETVVHPAPALTPKKRPVRFDSELGFTTEPEGKEPEKPVGSPNIMPQGHPSRTPKVTKEQVVANAASGLLPTSEAMRPHDELTADFVKASEAPTKFYFPLDRHGNEIKPIGVRVMEDQQRRKAEHEQWARNYPPNLPHPDSLTGKHIVESGTEGHAYETTDKSWLVFTHRNLSAGRIIPLRGASNGFAIEGLDGKVRQNTVKTLADAIVYLVRDL